MNNENDNDATRIDERTGIRSEVLIMVVMALLLATAFSFVLLKLVDQSDSHVKKVSETVVKTSSPTLWKPEPNECDLLLKRDAATKSQEIYACYRNLEFSKEGFHYLSRMKKLRTLKLMDCTVEDEWVAGLVGLPLVELILSGTEITGACATNLSKISSLEVLALNQTRFGDNGIDPLSSLPALNAKNLNNTRVSDAGANALPKFERLQALRVAGTRITSHSLEQISRIKNLNWLDFAFNQIVSSHDLMPLKSCKTLRKLILSRCALTDSDLIVVSSFSQINELHLDGNEISDAGFKHLTKLKSLKKLSLLDCKVSADAVKRFKNMVPTCEIIRGRGLNAMGF
ncbi:MAG: hypothetical protein K2Z81_11845 [Cyanobacteria bacterium]|nr:hypothetical protein [Cyanobacteriota bacterium]